MEKFESMCQKQQVQKKGLQMETSRNHKGKRNIIRIARYISNLDVSFIYEKQKYVNLYMIQIHNKTNKLQI